MKFIYRLLLLRKLQTPKWISILYWLYFFITPFKILVGFRLSPFEMKVNHTFSYTLFLYILFFSRILIKLDTFPLSWKICTCATFVSSPIFSFIQLKRKWWCHSWTVKGDLTWEAGSESEGRLLHRRRILHVVFHLWEPPSASATSVCKNCVDCRTFTSSLQHRDVGTMVDVVYLFQYLIFQLMVFNIKFQSLHCIVSRE